MTPNITRQENLIGYQKLSLLSVNRETISNLLQEIPLPSKTICQVTFKRSAEIRSKKAVGVYDKHTFWKALSYGKYHVHTFFVRYKM